MFKYLKEDRYYCDLYDLSTIKECLRICEFWENRIKELKDDEISVGGVGLDLELYMGKGERYQRRWKVITEWMDLDRKRDEKMERTEEPEGIRCVECDSRMKVIFKDLYCGSLKVLFLFECLNCKKRRGFFDDGEEYVSKGVRLSKAEMDEWDREDDEREDGKEKDKELLKKYRSEFCLSEKEGGEYIVSLSTVKELSEYVKETERKRVDPDYQKAKELKKLTVVELEKFVKEILEKEKYIKLVFDKPMIDKYVIVPVAVQDEDSGRNEYDSVYKLQNVLKKSLEGTNWRLMSTGVSYRLGYLSCKLKGYEQEADLVKLFK